MFNTQLLCAKQKIKQNVPDQRSKFYDNFGDNRFIQTFVQVIK